jgi:hypothetical protein
MTDAAAARHLAEVAGGDLSALGSGEFLLAVKNPERLVPRAVLVRARIPHPARGSRPVAAGRRAWEAA